MSTESATAANPGTAIVPKIIFPVGDMDTAVSFYRSLGFEVEAFDAAYAWVNYRGEELLHLALADEFDRHANRAAGYLHVQDVDAWHQAWSEAVLIGGTLGEVADQRWGMREFTLTDPAGNVLRVGANR